MSNIDKEWLQQKIADMEATRDEIPFGLDEDDSKTLAALRIALASLEAEAVCVIDQSNLDYLKSGSDADVWPASRAEMGDVLLYRSATPAPVSVPDGYRLQPISEYDAMCAAMLQGANGTLTNEGTITATQFKPVADLYGLTSPTGGETSFTFDAVEARDFIDGGWSCQEYVELERFQEAVSGNSPVIPDGWVLVPEEPTHEMLEAGDEQFGTYDVYRRMIAASPQQEVK
ncbi:TPA: ead/Ea22-like family protein [Enterobacter roggenkampii]